MNRHQLNPPAPAGRILLLPPGEGRDEGRLRSSSLIGSWSQCVSIPWKSFLPMNPKTADTTTESAEHTDGAGHRAPKLGKGRRG